jgi:muramoyltetrapeptide carboxypeptidase LdcA involved in peptidoglycan recycling
MYSTIGRVEPAVYPSKPRPGDRVAVLSPSAGLPELFPRPFELGIVGYHGGSVMVQFGRPARMHPVTAASLRAALFTPGEYELAPVAEYGDEERGWADPATFEAEPPMRACGGWIWHNADRVVEAPAWGGCLEVLAWLLMADRCIAPVPEYAGGVLLVETSEDMPSATEVYWMLRAMGERGLLGQFGAVLVGRAKAWSFEHPAAPGERDAYQADQRAAVRRAPAEYAPRAMAVFDVDLGHTDPQVVIPYGGMVRVDGPARRITVTY